MTDTRKTRRVLFGTVTSTRMEKTITVSVQRAYRHPKYGKIVRLQKKFHAHDENGEARVGDQVELVSTRPLSKLKRWRLSKVLVRSILDAPETDATNPEALNIAGTAEETSA